MTSRIELRKEQQKVVTTNTPSIGYAAGESVVTTKAKHKNILLPTQDQLAIVDNGFAIRGISEDGFEALNPAIQTTTTAGATIGPRSDKKYWANIGLGGSADFSEFRSTNDISEVCVSLESGPRATVSGNIRQINSSTYEITYGEILPVWIEITRRRVSGEEARWFDFRTVGQYTREEALRQGFGSSEFMAIQVAAELNALGNDDEFGSLVTKYSLDLHPRSTKRKESQGNPHLYGSNHPSVVGQPWIPLFQGIVGWYIAQYEWPDDPEGNDGFVKLFTYAGRYETTQVSGWSPGTTLRVSGTPPFTGDGDIILPVDLSVQFIDTNGNVVETKTTRVPANVEVRQYLHVQRTSTTATPAIKVSVGDGGVHNAWIKAFYVPLPRTFSNRSTDTYLLSQANNELRVDTSQGPPLQLFGHAAPINVPNIASLAGTRPNEYLTYSGTWNGTSFKKLRCRCPAWILYDVLTNERFCIELPATRIDTQSFLTASKYCQGLINSMPRWVFDGELKGTQESIIAELLRVMRGWLVSNHEDKYSLKLESPEDARWIICPSVAIDGALGYRDALPRPKVRANFTNRLTGEQSTTTGLDDAVFVDVPWQDPNVCVRWAQWETFSESNLLDSVEFSLPASLYSSLEVGDLIDLYDPLVANIRAAGRVLSYNATDNWVQLDGPPLGFWPSEVAEATLKQQSRTTIDPDIWGYVHFKPSMRSEPGIRIQKNGGGFTTHKIIEFSWLAAGRPEHNRLYLDSLPTMEDRAVWAIPASISPTKWRVQSIRETGRTLGIVATRYISGMHQFIESGTALPNTTTKWNPPCGTKLSQFTGEWYDLNDRYPSDRAKPFDDPGLFDDLTTSCIN